MPTIYILDDDASLLTALNLLLSRHKYKVATFTNSKDLLNAAGTVQPDMIFLDVLLAEADDGKSVCKRLKREYNYTNRIYLFSATPVSETEVQQCCADGFLDKP